jgi:hypothetical protein
VSASGSLLIWLVRWQGIILVGGLAAIIAPKLLTGSINTQYLLYGTRRNGTKYFSPGRVQLLVVTIAIAFQYLLNASHSGPGKFPSLPAGSLELLGLSNAFYLGGKAWFSLKRGASEQER